MAIDLGTAVGYIVLDSSSFIKNLDATKKELSGFKKEIEGINKLSNTSKVLDGVSNKMASVGKTLTTSITVPLAGMAAAIVTTASNFEAKMSGVKAITQSTGDDFQKLRDQAIDLGATTSFSAGEVADAMTEMAKAGWTTQQILDGMSGVLDAAAASGEDLGSVSTIMADAITGFGLKASDSARIADLLTQAANAGTIGISDLGETFKYIAPVANAMNMSVEDVTTAVSAMSMAGIKGSSAGTALRAMLTNLVKPTDNMALAMKDLGIEIENKDGSFKSLDDIVANLRTSFTGLTEKEKSYYAATLAGKEGMSGMLALLNLTEEEYNAIADSMDNAGGVAKTTAEIMQDNLKSKVEQLGGSLESLSIKLGDILIPIMQNVVEKLTGMVDKFSSLSKETQETILKIAAVAAAVGPLLLVGSKVISGISAIMNGIALVKGVMVTLAASGTTLGAAIGAALSSILPIIALIVVAVIAFKAAWDNNFAGIRDFTAELCTTIGSILSGLKDIFVAIVSAIKSAWENNFLGIQTAVKFVLDQIEIYLKGMLDFWSNIFKAIDALIHGDFSGAMDFLKKAIKGAFDAVKTVLENLLKAFGDIFKNIFNAVKTKMSEIGDNMKEGASNAVKGFLKFLNELPGKVGEIIGFVLGSIFKFVIEFPAKAKEAAVNFFNNVVNNIKNLPENIKEKLGSVVKNAGAFVKDFGGKAKDAASEFGTKLVDGVKDLPSKMKDIGSNIISGIWEGIKSANDWLKDKISDFAGGIVSGFKDALGIHSPSKVAENEVGKNIALGVADGIIKNASKAKNAAKDLSSQIVAAAKVKVTTLKEANKLSAADEVSFWKTIVSQTKAGTKARLDAEKQYVKAKKTLAQEQETISQDLLDKAEKQLDKYSTYHEVSVKDEMEYWDKIRKATTKGTEARLEADKKYFAAKEAYNEQLLTLQQDFETESQRIQEESLTKIEELESKYNESVESRTQQILGSFNLFEEYSQKAATTSEALMLSLQSQVDALTNWRDQLDSLENRNILPEDMVTEIRNMGVDASTEITAMNTMTDEQLAEYVELWRQKNQLAREQALEELKPLKEETEKQIKDIKKSADKELKSLQKTYDDNLKKLRDDGATNAMLAGAAIKDNLVGQIQEANTKVSSQLDSISNTVSSKLNAIKAMVAEAGTLSNSISNISTNSNKTSSSNKSHKAGLDYVPYDGYEATLHKGERVLTAQENSSTNQGATQVFNFYGTPPLNEKETARQIKKTQQELALGF